MMHGNEFRGSEECVGWAKTPDQLRSPREIVVDVECFSLLMFSNWDRSGWVEMKKNT